VQAATKPFPRDVKGTNNGIFCRKKIPPLVQKILPAKNPAPTFFKHPAKTLFTWPKPLAQNSWHCLCVTKNCTADFAGSLF